MALWIPSPGFSDGFTEQAADWKSKVWLWALALPSTKYYFEQIIECRQTSSTEWE